MRITIWLLALLLNVAACDDSDSERTEDKGSSKQATTDKRPPAKTGTSSVKDRVHAAVEKKAAEMENKLGIVTEDGPADYSSREAMCGQILAKADAAALLGRDDINGGVKKRPVGNPVNGHSECEWGAYSDKGIPQAIMNATIDCRQVSLNVDRWRSMMKAFGQKTYKDVNLGKGGGRASLVLGKRSIHQFAFVHDRVPCAVSVTHSFTNTDKTLELATHVYSKLNAGNAVMP